MDGKRAGKKLYDFITAEISCSISDNDLDTDRQLMEATRPEQFKVDKSYKGPVISLPLRKAHVEEMIEAFKQNKVL